MVLILSLKLVFTNKCLRVRQAARRRGVTRGTIHRWLVAGLKFYGHEGRRLMRQADLDAWVPAPVGNPMFF